MKSINTKLEKIAKQYEDTIKAYATTIFNDKVIPICLEKGLSYCTMNGFPQFYDKEGNRVEICLRNCIQSLKVVIQKRVIRYIFIL